MAGQNLAIGNVGSTPGTYINQNTQQSFPTGTASSGYLASGTPKTVYNTPSMATQPYQTSGVLPISTTKTDTTTPTSTNSTDSHQAMIDTVQKQIGLLQKSLSNAVSQGAGLNDQIDNSGNVISKTNTLNTTTPAINTPTTNMTPTPTNTPASTPTNATVQSVANTEANIEQDPDVIAARKAIVDLKNEYAQKGVNINQTAGFLTQANGEQGLLNQQYLTALDAATTNLNQLTNTKLQGLSQAGTQLHPTVGSYGQTQYNPASVGGTSSATSGTAGVSPNDPYYQTLQNYAKMAANGQLSQIPSDITSNPVLNDQMNQMAKAINPSYNPVLSQASATTQAQGQQIQTYATSTNAALDKLSEDFANLPDMTKYGIPGMIGIEQGIGDFYGNYKLSTYKSTLNDARAQLAGVLSTAGGMTPSGAEDMAKTYLPDNMTQSQFTAKLAAAKALVAQKVSSFVTSGQQGGGTANSSSETAGTWSW